MARQLFGMLVVVLLSFALLLSRTAATQFKVGDSAGWTVPTDHNPMPYSQWAMKQRFQIGDTLLFTYPADRDSVLVVDQNSYKTCNTGSFIDKFNDGYTVFTLTRSGSFYFISGNRDNCLKNETMHVVVMANRKAQPPSTPPPPPPNAASIKVAGLMGSVGVMLGFVIFGL